MFKYTIEFGGISEEKMNVSLHVIMYLWETQTFPNDMLPSTDNIYNV